MDNDLIDNVTYLYDAIKSSDDKYNNNKKIFVILVIISSVIILFLIWIVLKLKGNLQPPIYHINYNIVNLDDTKKNIDSVFDRYIGKKPQTGIFPKTSQQYNPKPSVMIEELGFLAGKNPEKNTINEKVSRKLLEDISTQSEKYYPELKKYSNNYAPIQTNEYSSVF